AREAAERIDAKLVSPGKILTQKCDILAPSALGGVLNAATIPKLRCRIVVGPANNQLASHADDRRLRRRNILYAPDFVVNGGGLINIACEMETYDREKARRNVLKIGETMRRIMTRAREEKITPLAAADAMVKERLSQYSSGPSAS
ncbi:MAG TPA: leucine dehydrogenase, partial [Nitrospiria bacterium]